MNAAQIVIAKKAHLARLANQGGASGELAAVAISDTWVARPCGPVLKLLLSELAKSVVVIKAPSFDAIAVPEGADLTNPESIRAALNYMVFIEIKSANQGRVAGDMATETGDAPECVERQRNSQFSYMWTAPNRSQDRLILPLRTWWSMCAALSLP